MNRRIFILIAALAATIVSCKKEAPAGEIAEDASATVIEAFQEGNATKATYNGSGIQWDANDAIAVFPSGASSSVKFSKTESGNYFRAGETVNLNGIYALFPYNSAATISGGVITTTIPTTQTATPGSFAPDANVAVAYSEGGNSIYFKNAVSYVKVSYKTTLTTAKVTKITFMALDGSIVSGRVALTPTVSDGVVTDVKTAAVSHTGPNYVELTGNILPNTDYYLVIAPVNLSSGYRIVFTDSDGNRFSKDYKEAKNKVRLQRNTISATGVKNLDNYTTSVKGYWRVKSADDFTGNNDKYLLVKNTAASATGYRVFDTDKTDVFISTGQPLVDKFAGGTEVGLSSKLASWKTGSSAPIFMSHYVLYCFRNAFNDNGLQFGPGAAEVILNPDDAYAFTVATSSDSALGKTTSFDLCYRHSGAQSTPVNFTNCYLNPAADNSFTLLGKVTQESIDGLVDVFYISKGSQFVAAVPPKDIHSGADRATGAYTIIGFCGTEVTTYDGETTMKSCFMIRNYYLCNWPVPEAIWIYKKATRQVTFTDYNELFSN